jgi:hypothetical protein
LFFLLIGQTETEEAQIALNGGGKRKSSYGAKEPSVPGLV